MNSRDAISQTLELKQQELEFSYYCWLQLYYS